MRLLGMALAIVLAAVGTAPNAFAAKGTEIPKEARTKGMAAAPGLVSSAGLDCQVSDARLVGEGTDAKTKAKTALYEIACTNSEGYLLQQSGAEAPAAFTCLQVAQSAASGKGASANTCELPGNSDPKAGLAAFVAKSGVACTPVNVRAIGASPSNTFFELACQEQNGGFILQTANPPRLDKPISANPCLAVPETSNLKCILTPRDAQLAVVDKLATSIGKPCAVKDRRFIGVTQGGEALYEVACQAGNGYVIEAKASGAFDKAIDCATADSVAGGCTLTDSRQAKTEQASLYTQLSKKAGYDCAVSGYAPLPASADMPPQSEAVELKCSNRPDGAIAIFPANGAGHAYDCAHSELIGYRCSLTKAPAAYDKLTGDLKALGKTSCQVSNARVVGLTADKKGYIEVACSDGLQGYMIEYSLNPLKPATTLVCTQATGIGGGCSLPGNKKS